MIIKIIFKNNKLLFTGESISIDKVNKYWYNINKNKDIVISNVQYNNYQRQNKNKTSIINKHIYIK